MLFESEAMKVVLAGLEPGQAIDLHDPAIDLTVAVLDGEADVWVDDAPRRMRLGDVAVVPAGRMRGMRAANGRAVVLHVVAPPPTPETHARVTHRPWPAEQSLEDGPAGAIRAEHRELVPHLEHLGQLADAVPTLEEAALRERLAGVLDFLRGVLLPHAGAEDASLYPVVDRVLRAVGGATRTMSEDHRAVEASIEELAALAERAPTASTRRDIQRALDGLSALVRVHFGKEEDVYVPLLEHLSPEEARDLEAALAATPGHEDAHAH
ncbi:MAG TPA: hemerythrin domain-containing protein [Actinomycetota bacterium]|nr:hemerythrin domain-containing protein [Actinomycetota bacterium]